VPQQLSKALSARDVGWKKINRTRANTITETIHQYPAYHFFLLTSTGLSKTMEKKLKRHSLFSKILVLFCGM
jgi:hypothetical protein